MDRRSFLQAAVIGIPAGIAASFILRAGESKEPGEPIANGHAVVNREHIRDGNGRLIGRIYRNYDPTNPWMEKDLVSMEDGREHVIIRLKKLGRESKMAARARDMAAKSEAEGHRLGIYA